MWTQILMNMVWFLVGIWIGGQWLSSIFAEREIKETLERVGYSLGKALYLLRLTQAHPRRVEIRAILHTALQECGYLRKEEKGGV